MSPGVRRKLRQAGLAAVAKTARREGWDVDLTRGGHLKWTHTSGAIVYASGTASDHHAAKNLIANLRQVERGEKPR